jgi:outer membrane protein
MGRRVVDYPSISGVWVRGWATILVVVSLFVSAVRADTLDEALPSAYARNPRLNAERAKLRATDENVPQALSAYRPQLSAALSTGLQGVRNLLPGGSALSDTLRPSTASLTASQTLFNGMKTASTVRQAEAKISSGRADLRAVEQDVLLDAATAYMGVLSNQSLAAALRGNMTFLRELLATTNKRYDAGDVTPTDVAQAQARLNRGLADLNKAEVALAASRATYVEVIGRPPADLAPAAPIDRLLPDTREAALAIAAKEHPAIIGATFEIDVAQWAIQIAQSRLYPAAGVQASALTAKDNDPTLSVTSQNIASVAGNLTVPVYDGGRAASQVRQAKELLSQTRIWLERVRARVQTAVTAGWVTHKGARVSLAAAESEVKAAQVAVAGVQTEARAGHRTTLDVLNAQQDLTVANARLILAQRDRVVASYALLSAMGRLDHNRLGLPTPDYDSTIHYHQVRDLPYGLNTPAGQ